MEQIVNTNLKIFEVNPNIEKKYVLPIPYI